MHFSHRKKPPTTIFPKEISNRITIDFHYSVYSQSFKLQTNIQCQVPLYPKRPNVKVIYENDLSECGACPPDWTGLRVEGEDALLGLFPSKMGKTQSE